ncbi:MAG: M81 family metallopeptidase [Sandaracinaceae bacterium]|nr:M81 family metallopeptidase [Sandaracinaceae bacterium]
MSPESPRKAKRKPTGIDVGLVGRALVSIADVLRREAKARSRSGKKGPGAAASRTLRIAIGRITQETNALSPVGTTLHDFESVHLLSGEGLIDATSWRSHEVRGFMKNAELSGFVDGVRSAAFERGMEVEFVPLVSAWAVSSGPLTRECYDNLVERLIAPLRNAKDIDAVLLSLHGGMGVHDLPLADDESPESDILRRVREFVPTAPIGVTLDLHGNIVPKLVERANVVQAYRTNPHRDHSLMGQKVGEIIVRTVAGEVEPVTAWRTLPMFLGGSPTIDFLPPMNQLFQRMSEMEINPEVLAVSVLSCHPWNWHPELGWATLVVANRDQALAERCAEELAEMCWDVRDHLPSTFATPKKAIEDARAAKWARRLGVCVLADASDVVTAGAPGDNTDVIRALIEHGQGMRCYASVRDPELVAMLWQEHRPGQRVNVSVGGKLDTQRQQPLHLDAKLLSLPRAHGIGRMAVLQVGTIFIIAVEGPALAIRPSFFANAGLKVRNADIVVVKNFFPFLMYFAAYVRMVRFVRTSGVTDFDAVRAIPFRGPMHPTETIETWRDADQRRRKVSS